jgi:hypothetical protein
LGEKRILAIRQGFVLAVRCMPDEKDLLYSKELFTHAPQKEAMAMKNKFDVNSYKIGTNFNALTVPRLVRTGVFSKITFDRLIQNFIVISELGWCNYLNKRRVKSSQITI